MKEHTEEVAGFTIELPRVGDEVLLAPMHVKSWKETYLKQDSGLTADNIDELLAHILTDTTFRKNTICEALATPTVVLYRVVKAQDGQIVGFLHGAKVADANILEGLYLLDVAKGLGVGSALMELFLSWIDPGKPCRLSVFSFNDSAITFYEKYGFRVTSAAPQLFADVYPMIAMERSCDG